MAKQNKQKRAADLGKDPVGPLLLRLALRILIQEDKTH